MPKASWNMSRAPEIESKNSRAESANLSGWATFSRVDLAGRVLGRPVNGTAPDSQGASNN